MITKQNLDDPRVRRTRKLLMQSFMELLAEKSFDEIAIHEITERVEVNRATFYNHFQDKYQLLDLTMSIIFSEILARWFPLGYTKDDLMGHGHTMLQAVHNIPAESVLNFSEEEILYKLLMAVCQWQQEIKRRIHPKSTQSYALDEAAEKQLYELVLLCLRRPNMTSKRTLRRLEIVATMVSSSIYRVVAQWSNLQEPESIDELIEQALPIILSYLKPLRVDYLQS